MAANHLPGRGGVALGLDHLDMTLQFLMTRYACHPDPQRAQAVAQHLAMVLNHPLVAEQAEYRAFYHQQLAHWQALAAEGKRRRGKGFRKASVVHPEALHG